MIVGITHSIINDDNEIYFYTKLDDNLTNEKNGIYFIHKLSCPYKWFLCENVENFNNFVNNEPKIFYDAEKHGTINAVILMCGKYSIKLTEFDNYDKEKISFRDKMDSVINFTKANKKRKINEPLKIPEIPKILKNYYCDRCEEDSMRFECYESGCYNNKKARLIEENKLKSYCDRCDEDGMRFCCDNSRCRNYHAN